MDRLEQVRQVVDEILQQQPDEETRRCGFVHLYGVAAVGALLAIKRGLDPQLRTVACMLHDIWSYKTGDPTDHACLSALEAEKILGALGCFTPGEIAVVCRMIAHHSSKENRDEEMDELLKDADVLQHYLYNPSALNDHLAGGKSEAWVRRLKLGLQEMGLDDSTLGCLLEK